MNDFFVLIKVVVICTVIVVGVIFHRHLGRWLACKIKRREFANRIDAAWVTHIIS